MPNIAPMVGVPQMGICVGRIHVQHQGMHIEGQHCIDWHGSHAKNLICSNLRAKPQVYTDATSVDRKG